MTSDYEAWMKNLPLSERADELSEMICTNNADCTLFLTEDDLHWKQKYAVHERDVICWLLPDRSLFVLRKADKIHWALVGHFSGHVNSGFWEEVGYLPDNTSESETQEFRLF